MEEQDTQHVPGDHPREDDRNVELEQSPVPDPEEKDHGAADDPQAD